VPEDLDRDSERLCGADSDIALGHADRVAGQKARILYGKRIYCFIQGRACHSV